MTTRCKHVFLGARREPSRCRVQRLRCRAMQKMTSRCRWARLPTMSSARPDRLPGGSLSPLARDDALSPHVGGGQRRQPEVINGGPASKRTRCDRTWAVHGAQRVTICPPSLSQCPRTTFFESLPSEVRQLVLDKLLVCDCLAMADVSTGWKEAYTTDTLHTAIGWAVF